MVILEKCQPGYEGDREHYPLEVGSFALFSLIVVVGITPATIRALIIRQRIKTSRLHVSPNYDRISPAAFTKNAQVLRCLACIPPLHRVPFSFILVTGRPFQKHPVSSIFHTSSGLFSLVISLARSFQLSNSFSFTSPSSPALFILHYAASVL